MPTLLAAAGVAIPENHKLDGVNLLPVMLDQKRLAARQLVWNGKAIRDGSWKLVVNGKGGEDVGLYDLSRDLGEQDNRAAAEPARVKSMLAELQAWKADVVACGTLGRGVACNTASSTASPYRA